jgi:periplasmic protein CpxP/Spy
MTRSTATILRKALLQTGAAAALLVAVATPAFAQPMPGHGQGGERHGTERHGGERQRGHAMGPGGMSAPRMTAAVCDERAAQQAGRRAYVETRLDLTAEQRPLWTRYADAARTADQTQRQACVAAVPVRADATATPATPPATPPVPPTIIERTDRAQRMMQSELERIQAVRPALEALYAALTPAQRQILDRPMREGRRAMGGRGNHEHGHGGDGQQGRGRHGSH